MKQWLFLLLLVVAVIAALNRPVYSMPAIFKTSTDLEELNGWSSCNNIQNLSTEKSYSGKSSSKLQGKYALSYIFNLMTDKLPVSDVKRIRLKARVYTESDDVQLTAVAKAHVGEKPPFMYKFEKVDTEKGEWVEVQCDLDFYWSFHAPDEISAYFMLESDGAVVYVDDMEVTIF